MTTIPVRRALLERAQKALTVQPDGKFDRANWMSLLEELRALLDSKSDLATCAICGYVGRGKDKNGQCPRCHWDELVAQSDCKVRSALNAMLTQFGMDEDEWNKPTFDQARAALLAEKVEPVGWQPIETAPTSEKDAYLVFVPLDDVGQGVQIQVTPFEGRLYPDGKDSCVDYNDAITSATHWMPLPAAPKEQP